MKNRTAETLARNPENPLEYNPWNKHESLIILLFFIPMVWIAFSLIKLLHWDSCLLVATIGVWINCLTVALSKAIIYLKVSNKDKSLETTHYKDAQNRYTSNSNNISRADSQDPSFLHRHWVRKGLEAEASQDKSPDTETKGVDSGYWGLWLV